MTYLKLTAATLAMVALTACSGPRSPQGNYGNPNTMESGYTGHSADQGNARDAWHSGNPDGRGGIYGEFRRWHSAR